MDFGTKLRKPVLIYMSKTGCPACKDFDPEWKRLMELNRRVTLVKFECNSENPPPPPLLKYFHWAPTVVLAGPKSYYRIFTPDDRINETDYDNDYVIKAKECNVVYTSTGPQHSGRPYNFNIISNWTETMLPMVKDFDEVTPPTRYRNYF